MTDYPSVKFVVRFPEALILCTSWEDADALTSCREFLTDHLGCVPSFEACAELFPEPIRHRRVGVAQDFASSDERGAARERPLAHAV